MLSLNMKCSVINDGKYINNEYNDVYLVTTLDPIPLEAFALQVRMCKLFTNWTYWISWRNIIHYLYSIMEIAFMALHFFD